MWGALGLMPRAHFRREVIFLKKVMLLGLVFLFLFFSVFAETVYKYELPTYSQWLQTMPGLSEIVPTESEYNIFCANNAGKNLYWTSYKYGAAIIPIMVACEGTGTFDMLPDASQFDVIFVCDDEDVTTFQYFRGNYDVKTGTTNTRLATASYEAWYSDFFLSPPSIIQMAEELPKNILSQVLIILPVGILVLGLIVLLVLLPTLRRRFI